MISPDAAADLRAERKFDVFAALLIGVIAVLAAVLAVVQIGYNQAGARADAQSARLEADLSARISGGSIFLGSTLGAMQSAAQLGAEGANRALVGLRSGDAGAVAVGTAEGKAFDAFGQAISTSYLSSGHAPLDAYTSGLLSATDDQLLTELAEQNRQVDLANDAGSREQKAVLGLSFLALAGVLTGLGAVLRESVGGWVALIAAAAMTAAAVAMALLAVI